jgi:hypothetical protein
MAVFREDDPGAERRMTTERFRGKPIMDASSAAAQAMREAAKRAKSSGSETDDWVGLIGGIIGTAAASVIPGVGLPAAAAIGAATGSAASGLTKIAEGKEAGGAKDLAKGATGLMGALGGIKFPSLAPMPEDPLTGGPEAEKLYPGEREKTRFDALKDLKSGGFPTGPGKP